MYTYIVRGYVQGSGKFPRQPAICVAGQPAVTKVDQTQFLVRGIKAIRKALDGCCGIAMAAQRLMGWCVNDQWRLRRKVEGGFVLFVYDHWIYVSTDVHTYIILSAHDDGKNGQTYVRSTCTSLQSQCDMMVRMYINLHTGFVDRGRVFLHCRQLRQTSIIFLRLMMINWIIISLYIIQSRLTHSSRQRLPYLPLILCCCKNKLECHLGVGEENHTQFISSIARSKQKKLLSFFQTLSSSICTR